MKKIDDLSALSELITAQWKPGVVTNAAFSADAFRHEIGAGTLYARELPGALVLLRRRGGYDRLNFYLQPGADLSGWVPEQTTVLEIPARERDIALRGSEQLWQAAGFTLLRRRVRLVLRQTPEPVPETGAYRVRPALPGELDGILELMGLVYDPMTSCIPTREELLRDIAAGDVLCAVNADGELAGFLHLNHTKRSTEFRHLAVQPRLRRQGIARKLFDFDFARGRTPQYMLWVDEDNIPARSLYTKMGYTLDGWSSSVWICNKKGND